jgi:hypothetical protein
VTVVERYLELGLRLGRHADELVDSYYGPDEIARRVAEEELRDPRALAEGAAELLADVGEDPWLAGQVRALGATARRLAGEELSYVEEVELVFGIPPRRGDEADFREAHRRLDDALPGTGGVAARYRAWFEKTTIPVALLEQAVHDTADELRGRTRAAVGLPDGEGVEIEFVTDKPWLGYAHYLGDLRTRISINTELPLAAGDLVHLTSHEIYGGHHTHRVWQETELVRGQGAVERTLDLLWSPEAVLSEGIAEVGPDVVAPDEAELAASVLGRLGLEYDAELGARIADARRQLAAVSATTSMLLHVDGATPDEAREFAAEWSLQPQARIDKVVENLVSRPVPGYVHCYWQGRELVERYARRDPARLRELMTSRLRPADLSPSAA